jgi:hypothetical protein
VADHRRDDLEPFPVPLPDGGLLMKLCDAGDFIAKPPEREHDKPEPQIAVKDHLVRVASGHETADPDRSQSTSSGKAPRQSATAKDSGLRQPNLPFG